ncbi:unnamed protein product [marine sediment metagenome]|uniref:Glutamate-1-semialdehyde 2,1-aminomutase n=1 Tax=marine sediment metagenome TaxID=412755 RepID=X1GNN0_9ZZZZ
MSKSHQSFEKAKRVMPGGVNSPVRAFRSVNLDPIFIESGKGAKIRDIDGKEYLDYVGSWGPLIIGHGTDRITYILSFYYKKGHNQVIYRQCGLTN